MVTSGPIRAVAPDAMVPDDGPMNRPDDLRVPFWVVVVPALAIATIVLVGWSVPAGEGLTSWGAQTASTPWTALMLAGIGAALIAPPRIRRWLSLVVTLMGVVSLFAPELVVSIQELVWADATQAPGPGIDVAVLLLTAATWTTTSANAPDGLSTTLAAGAGAVAVLSLVGRAIGAGWLTDAGAGSTEAGMSLPSTAMILLLSAGVWLLRAEASDLLVRGRRHQRVVAGITAVLVPVVVVWVFPTPAVPTRVDYATTALLVVSITLAAQLAFVASYHRDALRTVETMLDASPEPTLFVEVSGTIVRANRAMAETFGWSREELIGMPVDLLVPATLPHVEGLGRPTGDRGHDPVHAPPSQRVTAILRDGTSFPAEVTLSPVRLRGLTLVAATVRDVTAHEQQVALLHNLQQMQAMFMTAVSHELRTPLTVVMGAAETLLRHGGDLDDHERRAMLERLMANAGRLDVLLGDLLDVDRLRRGVVSTAMELDAGAVVHAQARRSAQELALDVEIDVADDVPRVVADPVLLPRVLDNLLANAAKYGGGSVEVHVRREDGGLVIVVDDHGPGVPEEMRDQVFEPFRRGDRINSATPGVGIGLSLVAGVAAAADGRAWVQDRDDGGPGASFRLFLPARVPAREPEPPIALDDVDDQAQSTPMRPG